MLFHLSVNFIFFVFYFNILLKINCLANNVFNNGKNYSYNFDLIKQGLNLSALLQSKKYS